MTTPTKPKRTPKIVAPPVIEPEPDLSELRATVTALGQAAASLAQAAGNLTPEQRRGVASDIAGRFTSRKFLLSVIAGATIGGADALGWHLETNTVLGLLGVLIAYLTGEVTIDATAVAAKGKK